MKLTKNYTNLNWLLDHGFMTVREAIKQEELLNLTAKNEKSNN